MRRSPSVCVLAVTALALPPQAVRAEDEGTSSLSPTSSWEASFNDGTCRLERAYSAGEQPHLLILEQNMPSGALSIALAGPALDSFKKNEKTRLLFGAGTPAIEGVPIVEGNRAYGQVLIFNDVSPASDRDASPDTSGAGASPVSLDLAAAQGAREIAVEQANRKVAFETGPLDAAFMVLNDCTAQIMRNWGLDPAVQNGLTKSVFPANPKRLANRALDAYPQSAVRELRGGTVRIAVFIDATGVPTGCRSIVSSGHDDIDKAVCKAMVKEQFLPALDAGGQAVASFWTTRVTLLPN